MKTGSIAAIRKRFRHARDPVPSAFTLVELLAVLGLTFCLVAVLVPSLAKTEGPAKGIQCLANHRRLVSAWLVYAADSNSRVANNFGVTETLSAIHSRMLANWANNVMTWGASGAVEDSSNTNRDWFYGGVLGQYADAPIETYRCPSDTFLSPPQVAAGWRERLRSVSMNSVLGRYSPGNDPTAQGRNWAFSDIVQYLQTSQVPKPSKTWVFADEHPDSINDGYYLNIPTASSWQDIPAAYHEGGCGFSFADGHAEIRKWLSATSRYPVRFSYPPLQTFDAAGREDFSWWRQRTGFRSYATGELLYGY